MKPLLLFISLVMTSTLLAQNEFITTWEATDTDLSITIPTDPANHVYDYTVDFGDGTILNNQTGNTTHTYSTAGDYTVKISGDFPKFYGAQIPGNINTHDLLSVEQWGNIQWESMASAFQGCERLTINATDVPDLSNVTDFSNIFKFSNININAPSLNNWDVSNITNMHAAFTDVDEINLSLDSWNISNVTDMSYMFTSINGFNVNLSSWDVSNVTNMEHMFENTDVNQPLNNWDVSNVTNMGHMFDGSAFNQPLDNWNVSNVTNMEYMFDNSLFNQSLDNWDVSSVTNMQGMFQATNFNQPLENWDVSNVQFMGFMFQATNFNQPLNSWDVSNVTSMYYMFQYSSFNQPLDNWNVSSVTGNGFDRMFYFSEFNQDLSSWDFNVTDFDFFVGSSAMDTQNYDLLLDRFVQLDLQDGNLFADGLEYCDIFTRENLIQDNNWNILFDEIGDDCNINYISGEVRFDENGDGCDSNDVPLTYFLVNANDGQDDLSTLPNDNGHYALTVNQGSFSVSMLNLPNYLVASPSVHIMTFTGTNFENKNNDFCITANQSVEDLSIELFPLDDAIPGFESQYELIVENRGTQPVSNVQITVNFDDKQSFVSATQTPSSTTSNSLTFTISNLPLLYSETINFTLLNEQPPVLNGGDIVVVSTEVTPVTSDDNPTNNTVVLTLTVVNSFDPNDKLVTQGDEITIDETDEYLDYKIRFQNVGTANALNVKITDTISNKLDWTTFQPINSSHDYRLEFNNQEEINFIFDNINLPYEAIDEPGSNGHVSFKIKPKNDVQIGDVIENKAYIFFDFNAPIITNTVSTTIVDNLGLDEYTGIENIKLLPNPASNQVEIIHETDMEIEKVEIFDINGRLVKTYKHSNFLNISILNSGVYFVKMEVGDVFLTKKLIINN